MVFLINRKRISPISPGGSNYAVNWYINDLSLQGQFPDFDALRAVLDPLLQLRAKRAEFKSRILCTRTLSERPAIRETTLREALQNADPTYRRLALTWLANSGPFWEDNRVANPEDYFHYQSHDVTEQGMGEAARRSLINLHAACYSFAEATSKKFQETPLVVGHGLEEDPLGEVEVPNFWRVQDVVAAVTVRPNSWSELVSIANVQFDQLQLADYLLEPLRQEPYEQSIADAVMRLLEVLHAVGEETLPDSSLTPKGMEIKNRFFTGPTPAFTDESVTNRRTFANELRFPDPADPHRRLDCSWHGKVKRRFYRIHFEWPRPIGQRKVKVVYIGPKITRG